MVISGQARLGRKTKELVKELASGEIAIIDHQDLDAMGAMGLVEAGVLAVLNAADSISGRYPNLGPELLLENQIVLIDQLGDQIFTQLKAGDLLTIKGNRVYLADRLIGVGRRLTMRQITALMEQAKENLDEEISKFVDNTMEFVQKEKEQILKGVQLPDINTCIEGRHVVVVVRGLGYLEDLKAIGAYIEEMQPILIGVDGGADALLECGHQPDIIIGDMDSITDQALKSGAELLVHAYSDGRCPGAARLDELGLEYKLFPAPGTSEDIALLLAYEMGAKLIAAVGLHSHMTDFLEKGRPGMASTFLVRMKIGSILVDAKGVSQLYQSSSSMIPPIPLLIAAILPIIVFVALASPWRQFVRLLWLQIRLFVGGL